MLLGVSPSPVINEPVAGGPAGLVDVCMVAGDPSGVLVRPAGTVAYCTDGVRSWQNSDGTAAGWVPAGYLKRVAKLVDGDVESLQMSRTDWLRQQSESFARYASGVSRQYDIPMVDLKQVGGSFSDGNVDGAGLLVNTASAWAYKSLYLLQNPKSVPFGFAVRGKFPTPVTAQRAQVGLVDDVSTGQVVVGSVYDNGAGAHAAAVQTTTDATGNSPFLFGGAIDAGFHTYAFCWDKIRETYLCDGAVMGQNLAAASKIPATKVRLAFRTIDTTMLVTDFTYVV